MIVNFFLALAAIVGIAVFLRWFIRQWCWWGRSAPIRAGQTANLSEALVRANASFRVELGLKPDDPIRIPCDRPGVKPCGWAHVAAA